MGWYSPIWTTVRRLAGVFEGIEEKSGEGAELWHEAHSFETS